MKVGTSVQYAIEDWEDRRVEAAMLHACNAVDGTAAKTFPDLKNRNKARFTRFLRENYSILGPCGMPGMDLEHTRFSVTVDRPTTPDGAPDLADVLYGVHRCTHGHGDELPGGFDLLPDAAGPEGITTILARKGELQLSDRIVFGLLAVAVLSPANVDQRAPDSYYLTFGGERLYLNEWWGRADDFAALVALHPMPLVTLDFGDWMNEYPKP